VDEKDFAGDGIHLNAREKRRLGHLYARVGGLAGNGEATRGK